MCGIFGVVWHEIDSIPDEFRLKETARLLYHRGPDSYDIYADRGIGLVHTRLSLVDLSNSSNQPFWDKQKRYCLVYNGEIYNFKELRTKLEQQGIQFKTTSDTEVLLESMLKWGIEATLPQLEGMFAFALYDAVEKTLVLARDRFGIKPLFVYDNDDTFLFASEIQAMRPWISLKADRLSISSFLQGFDGPTRGSSFFEGVKILPPGTLVKLRRGESAQYSKFFSLSDFWDREEAEKLRQLKPQQMVDLVDRCLFESVQKQMFADAQVGALCSGGVDSSIIMAMAAQFHNNLAIFHANVVGPNSEFDAAAKLAKHLKLDLKTVEVHDRDFIDLMPDVMEHYGYPFYRIPQSIPLLMVSRLIQNNKVKAVLTGEGADECYLGYTWLAPNITRWRHQPFASLKKLVKTLAKATKKEKVEPYWKTLYMSSPNLVTQLHNRFEIALEAEEIRSYFQNLQGANVDFKSVIPSLDLFNYNLRALLHRNDSMGMAASVESRFPFLDSELVKMAINMPYNCKIRFSITGRDRAHLFFKDKWVLRQVADRYLPKELSQRPKKPFPVNAFERVQIAPTFFEKSFVADLFNLSSQETRYLIENSDRNLKLRLLHLDVWGHICLHNCSKESMVSKLRQHIQITQQ
jgi:asparagine synthase (glutamine-hydrolysing)